MNITRPNRRVITFYSFKGGVGRTMALANVAYRLADTHALDVVAVDWDLEAPGLHNFFGLTAEQMAEARGVLDYLLEWREALRNNAPAPPDIRQWLIRIEDKDHAPRHGSLSLLVAGRIDAEFGRRLAGVDWKDFYENSAGAAAVETLREQLVGTADAVLIDSRTGLTDAGGICTVQLPDAVVLMSTPNKQSLDGIMQVARGIAGASAEERAGREMPKLLVSVSRISSIEESLRAARWFKQHKPWFDEGIVQGLWQRADHSSGLRSHEIPHRARWSFGEQLLNYKSGAEPTDPLAVAYQGLTGSILIWLSGYPSPPDMSADTSVSDHAIRISALRERVKEAEERGDMLGLSVALRELGIALANAEQYNEAHHAVERASDIALGGGLRSEVVAAKTYKGLFLISQRVWEQGMSVTQQALDEAQQLGHADLYIYNAVSLAMAYVHFRRFDEAISLLTQAETRARAVPQFKLGATVMYALGAAHELAAVQNKAISEIQSLEMLGRSALRAARQNMDDDAEARALGVLISLASEGAGIADVAELQTRLDELSRRSS
ncbi:KGGVGR-motif variant AAA ATPase [Sorangium sp. So ce124]|uniref:KGGVGR-motif variant AAA ATPase n=1 Tax=Sorangium sp. So ce124 TaxID=3133280 RepID=UPI003F63040F